MNTNDLLTRARLALMQARAIENGYAGQPMPAEAGLQMKSHLDAAQELRDRAARLGVPADPDELGYHVGIDDDLRDRSPLAKRLEVPLPPELKVRDHLGLGRVPEEVILGWVGHQVKAAVQPVDPAETALWARRLGVKDMGTGTVGAGGALVPTVVAAYLIDLMRANVVCQAAGARVVPMRSKTVQVPRLTGDVTSDWYDEGAVVTASDATLDQVELVAKRNEVGPVKISLELNEDSEPVGIGQVVTRSIAAAAALKLDQAALRGSGVAPIPKGLRNQTDVTLYAPGANGDALNWDLMLALARAIRGANAEPSAFVMTPGAELTLAGLKDTQSRYLEPPTALRDIPRLTTTSIPANLTKGTGSALTEVYAGDFRQLVIGMRTALSIQTLSELYRATGQVGIIARFRADVAVEHGPAFAVATFVDD